MRITKAALFTSVQLFLRVLIEKSLLFTGGIYAKIWTYQREANVIL
jgi:hypothetical protein